MINAIWRFIEKLPVVGWLIDFSKKIKLPGFDGLSIYETSGFFFSRLMQGDVQSRARSIAFSFFLALFPAIIFLFTIIPYVPIAGFQEQLLNLIQDLMPPNTFEESQTTLEDIILRQHGGLLSFGVLFTLYVASSGINSIIEAFNHSNKIHQETISPFHQRLIAIALTFFLAILFIFTIALLIFNEIAQQFLARQMETQSKATFYFLTAGKWIILLSLCFTAVSSMFYYGTAKRKKYRFISAGSTLATILIIITSLGFNYFIVHFGNYNKLYGSIGTLIIILLWLYFNCMQLLVGYELNVSIENVKRKRKISST
jgi:membrane protein